VKARRGTEFSRAAAQQIVGTTLSRVTGFGRVFALAYAIGFTRLSDAYNLANVTPNIVYELVLGGVLSATLVPVFVDRLEHDDDPWEAISAVVSFALAVAVAVSLALVALAPLIIHLYTAFNSSGSVSDENAVATALLRYFGPQVAFYSAITISTALLLARRRFANPKFSPIANNLVVIGVLMALPHVTHNLNLSAIRHHTGAVLLLGLGTTAGVAVQAFIQAPGLRHVRWVWQPRHEAVRMVAGLSFWTVGVVVANQIALYVALALANQNAGDVSVYLAAYMFFTLPHGVIAVSVMDALLPELAARWTRGDRIGFQRRMLRGLRTMMALLVPAAAGYVVLARPIVHLTLQYGALHGSSASTTANTLALFALGLPGFSAYLFLMRGFQSIKDTRSMFLLYVVENAINIVLAVALHPALGVEGLALSFGLAYTIASVVAWRRLARSIGGLPSALVRRSFTRIAVASAAMTIVVALISAAIGGSSNVHLVARVGASVIAGVSVYLLVARALHVRELNALFSWRRSAPSAGE
jgi:putative peptidoglycan lipid II flippase